MTMLPPPTPLPPADRQEPTAALKTASEWTHAQAALEHELHVHQIELESQNKELRRTQLDLAAVRDRFIDLYDFAPVGYVTLDERGALVEANLTAASMLGEVRKLLVRGYFSRFIARLDLDRWHIARRAAVLRAEAVRVELMLQSRKSGIFFGQLDILPIQSPNATTMLRVTLSDITPRKQAEMDRRMVLAATDAREAERRRVAHELHENLGQRLSALKMELATLRSGSAQAEDARIDLMLVGLDDAVATVRRLSAELRPLMLDDLGLNAAVEWLAHDWARRLGIKISVELDEIDPPLDERSTVAMFRMVEESLAHLVGQGRAVDLAVTLRMRADELVLSAQAYHPGWQPPPHADLDTVLLGLREKAQVLGGRLEVRPASSAEGACITVRLVLPRRPLPPAGSTS